jgi:microcystin-dependent protein
LAYGWSITGGTAGYNTSGTSTTNGANQRHQHSFTPSGTIAMTNANNTGGGGAHNNLQPYLVMNYIIRAV